MNKILRLLVILLVCIGIFSIDSHYVHAEGQGTIAVDLAYEDDDENMVPVPGATYDVYKVWETNAEKTHFEFVEPFIGVTNITPEMTSDEIQSKVDDFLMVAEASAPVVAQLITDNNGHFQIDLPYGAYLFVPTNEVSMNDELIVSSGPFLVTLPLRDENGNYIDYVDASPKVSHIYILPADKTVNGGENYDMQDIEEVLTYTIVTDIPRTASESYYLVDEMPDVLEFEPGKSLEEIMTITINGVALTPEQLNQQVTLDNNTLRFTATENQLKFMMGMPLIIEFNAKIRSDADLTPYRVVEEGVENVVRYNIDNEWHEYSKPATIVPPPDNPPSPPPLIPPPTGVFGLDGIYYGLLSVSALFIMVFFLKKKKA